MIVVIRIRGKVKLRETIEETLYRLGLRKKYSCILINEKDKVKIGMLKKVQDHVAFGEIDKPALIRLIEKRAKPIEKGKKINANKIALEILNGKGLEELGIKKFFRLHPPRKGLKSSKQKFPKGNLGNYRKEINKLIERML
jgi:large subunit ribosomal protein L30